MLSLSNAERRYHVGQYDAAYRSTQILGEYIARTAGRPLTGQVMDVGCGGGANLYWLDRAGLFEGLSPHAVHGIDHDRELIEMAVKMNPRRFDFWVADFHDLLPRADYVLSIQVLSFIEDWRPALTRLLEAADQQLYVTSLFWDGVETHTHASDEGHQDVHYNVIDAREFERACAPAAVTWQPFVSEVHYAERVDRLGTLTLDGHDFSGPLHLPWRIAMVR